MSSPDINKNSEELAHEVHGQIDKIGANIEHVRTRLSPGNLLDDAIFYSHGSSLNNTYTHLKNNPMGSMFLSLGTLLLMEDEKNRSYEMLFKQKASETGHTISDKTSEWTEKAKSSLKATKESLLSKSESAKEDLLAGARDLESSTQSKGQKIMDKARELKDLSAQKLKSARESAKEGWNSAKSGTQHGLENARDMINRAPALGEAMHPYAIASMGLGLGATLGASISIPQVEERLNSPEFQKNAEKLGNDFDFAIKEAGDRIKNHLIDELKNFNFH